MSYKSVEWAYPTSDNARRFGFVKSGCWTVETSAAGKPPKALAGYAQKADALAHAKTIELNWHPAWLRFNQPPV